MAPELSVLESVDDVARRDTTRVIRFAEMAPADGPNPGALRGLTTFRVPEPVTWMHGLNDSLTVALVVQGRHELTLNGSRRSCRPFEIVVLSEGCRVEGRIQQASAASPFLAFVLEMDSALVRKAIRDLERVGINAGTRASRSGPRLGRLLSRDGGGRSVVDALIRSSEAIRSRADRSLLGPLHLQEVTYRLLQTPAGALLAQAAQDPLNGTLSAVIGYLEEHLGEPITVLEMAAQANLSASAFGRHFRQATGQSPYQFLKEMRMGRACDLLLEGNVTVDRVSKEVGYASVSQFSSAFRARFGVSPLRYGLTSGSSGPAASPAGLIVSA